MVNFVANVYVPVVLIFILWYNYTYTAGLNIPQNFHCNIWVRFWGPGGDL